MATEQAKRRLAEINDALYGVTVAMRRIADEERATAEYALNDPRPQFRCAILYTPWAGRMRVTSLAAWDYIQRGGTEHPDAVSEPIPRMQRR